MSNEREKGETSNIDIITRLLYSRVYNYLIYEI